MWWSSWIYSLYSFDSFCHKTSFFFQPIFLKFATQHLRHPIYINISSKWFFCHNPSPYRKSQRRPRKRKTALNNLIFCLKDYFSCSSTKIKFRKITNFLLCHDSSHLNIDNSRIKNVTAKLLCTFVLTIKVKTVCKFQVIWMRKKNKVLCILVQKLSTLRKWTIEIVKSVTTHSTYCLER